MSLYAELRRRKVFKVGAAYLVVAWLLIQVVATLAPQLQLPDWAPRLVTLLLMVGFPVALLLAWMLDVTPDGVKVEVARAGNGRMYAIAAALVAAALGWYFFVPAREPVDGMGTASRSAAGQAAGAGTTRPEDDTGPASFAAVAPPQRSIAVLAFANLSEDKSNEHLADGLSEEILNALAQVRGLKVAGRTSSFHYKGRNEDLRTIGKALGVAHVLEGSVRRQGDRVRITAQLVQAEDGFHLWSDTYDGNLDDVFALQERVARAVSDALQVTLSDSQAAQLVDAGTANAQAYALYLAAAAAYRRRDAALYAEAISQLEQALVLDPDYARAEARAAMLQALMAAWEPTDGPAFGAARVHAERALALDPRLAEPHAALGLLATRAHRWIEARASFERALALAPQDAEIVFSHGRHLMQSGYLAAGLARVERALLIDPAHPNALWRRALASIDAGDIAAAELAIERTGELDFAWLDRGPLELARARGDWPQARRFSQALNAGASPNPHYGSACLRDPQPELDAIDAAMYGGSPEERARARALIERCLASRPPVIPERMQIALLRMGEPELALAAIAAGPSSGQAGILVALWGPPGDAARRSPQFAAFARDYGYAALWDEHGPPDGCRRLAPAEYRCD